MKNRYGNQDYPVSITVEIRAKISCCEGLYRHLAVCGWEVSLVNTLAKKGLFIISVTIEQHKKGEDIPCCEIAIDKTLLKLQHDVDFYLELFSFSEDQVPEWQVKLNDLSSAQFSDWEKSGSFHEEGFYTDLLDKLDIELDPGWAFGNGSHPTTVGCLKALQRLEEVGYIKSARVIDIGTGTGILAIFAARMGAEEVVAVDIDPEAIYMAKLNVRQNDFNNRITVHGCSIKKCFLGKADIIIANLTVSVMRDLFKTMHDHADEDSRFLVSGFKQGGQPSVNRLFASFSFYPEWEKNVAGWVTEIYSRRKQ